VDYGVELKVKGAVVKLVLNLVGVEQRFVNVGVSGCGSWV
jgi:hypothetical protein